MNELRERAVMIIAMQGYPCTGKTTVAKGLAETLQCPLVHFDDILDVLSPTEPPPEEADALMAQAFDLITQIVKTQVSLGLSIVVDSPLSPRSSHLDKLLALLAGLQENSSAVAPSLIIIECKPNIRYVWENRFVNRFDSSESPDDIKWYNPKEWTDVWRINIMARGGSTDHAGLSSRGSKLVIDTTDIIRPDLLAEAVRDMAQSTGRKVELKEWIQSRYEGPLLRLRDDHEEGGITRSTKGFCTDGHCVNRYMEEGIGHYAICAVCAERVLTKSPAYACRSCSLAVHKSCAEFPARVMQVYSFTLHNFYKRDSPFDLATLTSYCYPEKHLCLRCRLQGNDFSYDCASCIFHCHLRCGLIPTILNHEAHQHRLFFWVRPISAATKQYLCAACRRPGHSVAYGCMEGCDLNYHPECPLLPDPYMHSHGGHQHYVKLIFSSDGEELEDYFCDVCHEPRNPKAWYYYCLDLDCMFSSHPPCITYDYDCSSEQSKALSKINKL